MTVKKYRRKMDEGDVIEFRKKFNMDLDSSNVFIGKSDGTGIMEFYPVGYGGDRRWATRLVDLHYHWTEVKSVDYKNKRRSHVDSKNKT